MRKLITVAGIVAIAAIVLIWSQFDRKPATAFEMTGSSAPISSHTATRSSRPGHSRNGSWIVY